MQRLRPYLGIGAALAAASLIVSAPRQDREPPDLTPPTPRPLTKRERIEALKATDAARLAKQKAQRAARRKNRP